MQTRFILKYNIINYGRNSCIEFKKSSSPSENIKQIRKTLKKEVKGKNIDDKTIENVIRDIEHQIINKKDEIYNLNKTKTFHEDSYSEFKSKFFEDVSNLREQFKKASDAYKEWQGEVKKKYENLKSVANRTFPDSWQLLQFCISAKSIQNIYGNVLPSIGFILYKPSSLKSTIVDLFQKYPSALSADDITKNSFYRIILLIARNNYRTMTVTIYYYYPNHYISI